MGQAMQLDMFRLWETTWATNKPNGIYETVVRRELNKRETLRDKVWKLLKDGKSEPFMKFMRP